MLVGICVRAEQKQHWLALVRGQSKSKAGWHCLGAEQKQHWLALVRGQSKNNAGWHLSEGNKNYADWHCLRATKALQQRASYGCPALAASDLEAQGFDASSRALMQAPGLAAPRSLKFGPLRLKPKHHSTLRLGTQCIELAKSMYVRHVYCIFAAKTLKYTAYIYGIGQP
eukprot:387772-Pelagomonas_calceolata.AAC.1